MAILTPRQLGQRRRRQREEATGRRPQGPRLAEYSLRVWCEEWAHHPWSDYLESADALAGLARRAEAAGFRSLRAVSLDERLRRILAQGEDG